MKYSMFVGRWQTWHNGHQWLIDQRLKEGKNVLLCIRDVESNENNPRGAQEIYVDLLDKLRGLISSGRGKLMVIPDIESVNYGRGVGYEVIEHTPPEEIKEISGTKIRNQSSD